METQLKYLQDKIGKAKAKCTVGQQMVSEAEITFALVDQN